MTPHIQPPLICSSAKTFYVHYFPYDLNRKCIFPTGLNRVIYLFLLVVHPNSTEFTKITLIIYTCLILNQMFLPILCLQSTDKKKSHICLPLLSCRCVNDVFTALCLLSRAPEVMSFKSEMIQWFNMWNCDFFRYNNQSVSSHTNMLNIFLYELSTKIKAVQFPLAPPLLFLLLIRVG